jgi:DNA polymerase
MNPETTTLKEEIPHCTKCELVKTRKHVIFGEGNANMAGADHRITRDQGNWLNWQNRFAMPVDHPAALLRDPLLKRDTWEDFKTIVFKYRKLVNPNYYSAHI